MKETSAKHKRWLVAWLMLACLAVYANTFSNDFVWDDVFLISGNPLIKDLGNIPLFFTPHYWRDLHPLPNFQDQYRPLRTVTLAVDYFFWKDNPAGFHLTNLLLHMMNVILVFFLTAALAADCGLEQGEKSAGLRSWTGPAFLTALLFAVHPVHTESVTYI